MPLATITTRHTAARTTARDLLSNISEGERDPYWRVRHDGVPLADAARELGLTVSRAQELLDSATARVNALRQCQGNKRRIREQNTPPAPDTNHRSKRKEASRG